MSETKATIIRLAASVAILAAALIMSRYGITVYATIPIYALSYLIAGGPVLLSAGRDIAKGKVFDESILVSVATIGAFAIGYFDEGVAVMLFYQVGELLQDLAVGRSRRSISALMDIRPDTANLLTGDEAAAVDPSSVCVGDLILVRPGEKIPLDGVVEEGSSMVDTSALTGEPVPREASVGLEVLAGFVNVNGLLKIKVSREYGQSTVSRVLEMMQTAGEKKAPTENFITVFARYYTPAVVGAAVLIALIPPLILSQPFDAWIYRALVFLMISCPCALVLSIPLGFFGGIGAASRIGVLVKGSNYLEALGAVDTMVFDKTGTLTKGVFKVTQILTADGYAQEELLRLAALAETHSTHPIANSIREACPGSMGLADLGSFEEIAGFGTIADVGGRRVLVGNARLLERERVAITPHACAGAVGLPSQPGDLLHEINGTTAHIAVDGRYAGAIVISDIIKEDSASAMKRLRAAGVSQLVMLTGDNKKSADAVAAQLGIDAVYSELLPDQKVAVLESLLGERVAQQNHSTGAEDRKASKRTRSKRRPGRRADARLPKRKLAFVGDGINDAPVLARADVGISMGGIASDAAIEAADVVLMTDEPGKLPGAIAISRKTKRIVWQNIVLALSVKGAVLLLGALGIAAIWMAVFADVGVALLAVVNSLRVLRVPESEN
ncbi:MAG: heavy metal translocating P-type ATPase [Oscillospiraceae bacterium]|nr:heavy metal translocating P-type ATPase [Oscillospiraceae bacterium]